MATIGGSTNSSLWTYKIDVYDISTNVDTNTSVMRVDVWLGRLQSRSYVGGNWSGHVSINWETAEQVTTNISGTIPYPTYVDAGGWLYLATVDFTVPHNADGARIIRVTSELTQTQFTPSYAVADGWVTLTTIPRATVCPSLTGFIKSSYNLVLSPASNSFTHSLLVRFGNINKYVQADGTLNDNEYVFSTRNPLITLPKEFYSQFNGYEGTGGFTLTTYNGTQQIGTSMGTLKAQCNPALCSPSVTSSTVIDINQATLEITNNENDIIKYMSHVQITPIIQISDTDDSAATLISKSINGITFATDDYVLETPLDKNFTLTITNNRNITTNTVIGATGQLLDYLPLTFNIVGLYRPEPTTGEIEIEYNGNYFDDVFNINVTDDNETEYVNNTLSITWQYREKGSDTWITGGSLAPTIEQDKNTYSGDEILGTMFDYTKQYEFMFSYEDALSIGYKTDVVSRGFPVFWWNSDSFHILGDLYVEGVIHNNE